jgi:molybdopterin-guanine dinucleotide biosynthesis protein A
MKTRDSQPGIVMKKTELGIGILAGGTGRRMGTADKANLRLGNKSFLEHIIDAMNKDGREILISVGDRIAPYPVPYPQIPDLRSDCGAMGGILSLLNACASRYLQIIPCDMPLFPSGLPERLSAYASAETDAVIPVNRRGQPQPICGLYAKTATDALLTLIEENNYRMNAIPERLRTRYLPLAQTPYGDEIFTNINTPEAYQDLLKYCSINTMPEK